MNGPPLAGLNDERISISMIGTSDNCSKQAMLLIEPW